MDWRKSCCDAPRLLGIQLPETHRGPNNSVDLLLPEDVRPLGNGLRGNSECVRKFAARPKK